MTTEESGSGHLLLIDGLNIVRHVYEANPAPDSADKAQDAARSSLASFRRALEEHKPTHVLAPFDFGGADRALPPIRRLPQEAQTDADRALRGPSRAFRETP